MEPRELFPGQLVASRVRHLFCTIQNLAGLCSVTPYLEPARKARGDSEVCARLAAQRSKCLRCSIVISDFEIHLTKNSTVRIFRRLTGDELSREIASFIETVFREQARYERDKSLDVVRAAESEGVAGQ